MKHLTITVVFLAFIALALPTPTWATERGGSGPAAIEGVVAHIDEETRSFRMGALHFEVPREVEGFDDLEEGDAILVDYNRSSGRRVVTRIEGDLSVD
jgi:hypothetical protein